MVEWNNLPASYFFGEWEGEVKNKNMIIDTLKNAARYYSLHPLFAKAFGYVDSIDLAAVNNTANFEFPLFWRGGRGDVKKI